MTTTKYQIHFQSPDHPKGPEFWQKGRVFKTRQNAEAALVKTRKYCPEFTFKIEEKS